VRQLEEDDPMDRGRFDALARLVSRQQSRRSALAAILAAVVLGLPSDPVTGKPKRKRRDKGKIEKRDRRRGDRNRGSGRDRVNRQNRKRKQADAEAGVEAVPTTCCSRNACKPGPGANLGKCCFEDAELAGQNFKGANLGSTNFSRAILTNANFSSANLGKTCFVDADVTGARFGNANLSTAIFCRTQTDDGEDNSGCDRGTPCCPTCDDAHPCGDGELCCDGRCVEGNCCDNGEQSTCEVGELCRNHRCAEGVCCQAADCPNEICQRRTCEDHQCVYSPVLGRPGPRCPAPRVCCQDAQGAPFCCPEGATTCDGQRLCCTAQPFDETCAVGTDAPKCGETTNNCGQRIDCGPCAERICEEGSCTGPDNTCAYTAVTGRPGPQCPTLCCRDASGNPACCDAGATQCFRSGGCQCANKRDCPTGETCCDGECETAIWANETTFGNGPRTDGGVFQNIIGVAVSGDEQTAWVVDQGRSADDVAPRVSVWTRRTNGQWEIEAFFGSRGSGPGEFELPYGVAVSDDGLTAFVSDQGGLLSQEGSRISVWRKQPNGSWTNPLSLGNGTGNKLDQFQFPTGVAVSGDGRTLWVVDTGNERVSVWRESNGSWAPVTTFGSDGTDPGQFSDPTGIAVSGDGQTAWVIDRIRTRVSVWTRQANDEWDFVTEFGSFGDRADQWRGAQGVAVAADGQTVFVADLGHDRIMIWTRQPNGEWAHQENFSGPGNGREQLDGPFGVAAAADGQTVWISDQDNFRVSVWSLSGCPAPDG
jgi:DNA-binding beta-propeller fold protein YncE